MSLAVVEIEMIDRKTGHRFIFKVRSDQLASLTSQCWRWVFAPALPFEEEDAIFILSQATAAFEAFGKTQGERPEPRP